MAEGFRIAEAFVEIVADDDGLYASMVTKIGKAAAGTEIKVPIEPDATGLNEKIKAATAGAGARNPIELPVRTKRDALSVLSGELDQIASKLGISWGRGLGAIMVSPVLTAIKDLGAGATAILGQVTAGIEDLGGAAAILPAGIAVGVAAMTTFKLGVKGVGDAIKTANTPAEIKAQQEALNQLTPSARSAAEALIGLKPIWSDMQKNIQEHLFRGWAEDLTTLGQRLIPVLRTELGEMATSINLVGQRLMETAVSGPFVRDLIDTLSNGSTAVANMGPGLEAVMQILRNIIAEGATFLPGLATSFSDAAKNAALFVQEARNTGKLHEWMQSGIDAVRNLWQGLKNIFATLHMVAQTTREIMPEMWGGFAGITGKIREFVAEAQKSGQLKEWVQGGLEALRQLGQIVGNLIATFLALGDSSISILDILVGITGALRWMAENVPILLPLIGALFLAFKVAQTVVSLMQMVKIIKEITLFTKLWTAAQWLLNTAFLASPIGWIVLAVAGLVAAAILIITHWTQVKDFFAPFFSWIGGMFSTVFGGIWSFLSGLWNDYLLPFFTNWGPVILAVLAPFIGIPLLIYQNWDKIKAWLGGIWDWVWGKATSVWDAIAGFFTRNKDTIIGIITDLGRGMLAIMTGGLSELVILIVRNWDDIVGWFKAAPGRIMDALRALPGQMLDLGKSIIDGIWHGIERGWNWLMDKVRNLARSLLDAAKAAIGISSPSKMFNVELGQMIPPGVVAGVRAALPEAKRALEQMMQQLSMGPPTEFPGSTSPGGNWLQRMVDQFGTPEARAAAKTEIGTLVLNIAGNLDPTNPTAWRKAIEDIRSGIRDVERSYA